MSNKLQESASAAYSRKKFLMEMDELDLLDRTKKISPPRAAVPHVPQSS